MSTVRQLFDTTDAFLNYALRSSQMEAAGQRRSSREGEDRWAGVAFNDAVTLARTGWPEGVREIKDLLVKLAPNLQQDRTITYSHDVMGDVLDIGAWTQGHPMCMLSEDNDDGPSQNARLIHIHLDASVNAGWEYEQIQRRGAAAAAVIMALETNSLARVKLTIGYGHSKRGGLISYLIKIKDYQDPMDIDRVAFWVVNPASYRRIEFSAMETEDSGVRSEVGVPGGYGMPVAFPDLPCTLRISGEEYGSSCFSSEARAIEACRRMLNDKNVQLVLGNQLAEAK